MIKIGSINKLKVLRESDISFILTDGKEEFFLHKNESNYQKLKENDIVNAFLYFDQAGRLAATLKTPLLTIDDSNLLEVSDVNYNLGVFLKMGISKELLLSKDDLPLNQGLWPIEGDRLYVKLAVKKKLVAKLDYNNLKSRELKIGEEKEFYVQKIGENGLNLVSDNLEKIFVHKSLAREDYRIGEKVKVKVINENEKDYFGSLIKQKEFLMIDDAKLILKYLEEYEILNLNNKSSVEE